MEEMSKMLEGILVIEFATTIELIAIIPKQIKTPIL